MAISLYYKCILSDIHKANARIWATMFIRFYGKLE